MSLNGKTIKGTIPVTGLLTNTFGNGQPNEYFLINVGKTEVTIKFLSYLNNEYQVEITIKTENQPSATLQGLASVNDNCSINILGSIVNVIESNVSRTESTVNIELVKAKKGYRVNYNSNIFIYTPPNPTGQSTTVVNKGKGYFKL